VRIRRRQLVHKFFADRGTHLAAMVAYFALLSFVPLVFLALALLGLAHRADASDFFVQELSRAFPGSSLESILKLVHSVQENATALGIIGGVGLLWSSTSLFSALESALNIVYGRPNRSFLHGKGIAAAMMAGSLVTLFASLVVGAIGVEGLRRYLPGVATSSAVAYLLSVAVSLLGVFLFLVSVYRLLPNTPMTVAAALPGAIASAVVLEASFQVLPVFVRYADVNVTLRVLGGPTILLLWLYVMANVIVFGAELNWWWAAARSRRRLAGSSLAGDVVDLAAAAEEDEPGAGAAAVAPRDGEGGDDELVVAERERGRARRRHPLVELRVVRAAGAAARLVREALRPRRALRAREELGEGAVHLRRAAAAAGGRQHGRGGEKGASGPPHEGSPAGRARRGRDAS
jgi:membrane protein